jgi:hypothetical protein
MKIEKVFKTSYEELHPTVVSVLEDEKLVKDILLAKICAVIPSEFEDKTAPDKQEKKCLTIKGKDFFAEERDKPVYFIDVIYELLFPREGEEDYKNLVEDIKSDLKDKKITSEMIEKEINTLKEKINAPDLPKKEKDLYKIWFIMLKELQK